MKEGCVRYVCSAFAPGFLEHSRQILDVHTRLEPAGSPTGIGLAVDPHFAGRKFKEESCLPSMCGWALQLCQLPEHRSADAARKHKAVEQLLGAHSRQIT